jgi:hypothetical protein
MVLAPGWFGLTAAHDRTLELPDLKPADHRGISPQRDSRGFKLTPIGNIDSWRRRLANTQWYR